MDPLMDPRMLCCAYFGSICGNVQPKVNLVSSYRGDLPLLFRRLFFFVRVEYNASAKRLPASTYSESQKVKTRRDEYHGMMSCGAYPRCGELKSEPYLYEQKM